MKNKVKIIYSLLILLIAASCAPSSPVSGSLATAIVGENLDTNDMNIGYSQLSNVSDTKTYSYVCTEDTSDLSVGGYLSQGSFSLLIKDNSGVTLLDRSFSNISGYNQELVGASGTWTVEVELTSVSGEIGIDLNVVE